VNPGFQAESVHLGGTQRFRAAAHTAGFVRALVKQINYIGVFLNADTDAGAHSGGAHSAGSGDMDQSSQKDLTNSDSDSVSRSFHSAHSFLLRSLI
jgi:hypothetical protein